ncbi:flagellar hook-length control protein FliK [uncultured Desulfobacter sp.]|uniref:flagellar hook-length control protein FliK n=1 Tax=uncultured Desulfobacter sp. TaxID=240139 RepID=UPI002AAC49E6|nr:flagellar hook-length control protein FliK [uncultured Desulfobacter sp.]
MTSNVSNINVLLTGSASDALMGAASTGTVSKDNGFSESAFQGQLDKAMQRDTDISLSDDISAQTEELSQKPNLATKKQSSEISTVDKSSFAVRTIKQKVAEIEDALENGGGLEFLSELKNLLLSLSNCDLDNMSIDKDGLEALGDLLVQAGFDQTSVEELVSDLTISLEEGDGLMSVSHFMDDLFELPLAEEDDITQAEVLMPTSDLPYIKSLLSMMGVDEQEIVSVMDEASQGARGFDFDDFIEQLDQLLQRAENSGQTYAAEGEDGALTTLVEQLDLDSFIDGSGEPLTLATLIDAFTQKLNLIKDNPEDQAEQIIADMFETNSFDAPPTQSGQQELLNQLLSGLNIQTDNEETVDSAITISANSDAMVEEIEDHFHVQFIDQISRGNVTTKTVTDGQATDNATPTDIQTEQTDSDDTVNKMVNTVSDTAGYTKESVSQVAMKTPQADAELEEISSTTNSQSGETTSKNSENQTLVFGVEKTNTTTTSQTSGTQRMNQSFSTLPDFVTRQVGKSLVRSINTGDDTIRMQLRPPELGRVYMSIDHNGNTMKVSVITEHQSTKDILAANVNEIRTMLSSSGITLESFEVDMSSNFQQSMTDARAQDRSAKKQQTKNGAGNNGSDDVTENLTVQDSYITNGASLHFVA